MPMPPVLSPARIEESAVLYTEHEWTLADIAEHFDVSPTAVKNSLVASGVTMRPLHRLAEHTLKVKQCSHCLHFLPIGMFAFTNAAKRRRASWCTPCTAHPTPAPWRTNSQPLTQAVSTWRMQ